MAHEINLVPDIKLEMLRKIRMRNITFFVCIVVVAVSIGTAVILGIVTGGQRIAMETKKSRIESMSDKLANYENLDEFLTIQDQLGNIATINSQRRVLSRVFNVLDAMLPRNGDTVTISDLTVDLEESTLAMDAQADAGQEPLIDYRVLEAFKKSVAQTKYDYGRYVTANNNEIPTRCMVEVDNNGETLQEDGSIYAYWLQNREGCNPDIVDEDLGEEFVDDEDATDEDEENDEDDEDEDDEAPSDEYDTWDNIQKAPKIYRTPLFADWVEQGYMTEDGSISNIAHFESKCIQYQGVNLSESDVPNVRWTATNDCMLTDTGLTVSDSSNGKDANDNLVLRFSANVEIDPEIFSFNNKHMLIIGPVGQDVTDSYKQIEGMFAKRAEDCAEGDTECATNTINRTGTTGGDNG